MDANTLSMLMSLLSSNTQSTASRQSDGAQSGNDAYRNDNFGRGYNYAEKSYGGTQDKRSAVRSNFAMENGLGEKVNLSASQNNDNKKSSFDISSLLNLMRGSQNGGEKAASVFGNASGQGNNQNTAQGLSTLAPLLAMLSGGSGNGNADMSQLLMSLLMSNMQKSRPSAEQNASEPQNSSESAAKNPSESAAKNADGEEKAEEILKNELNNSYRPTHRSAGDEKTDKNKTQPKSKNIFQPIAFAGYAAISALNLLFGSAKQR